VNGTRLFRRVVVGHRYEFVRVDAPDGGAVTPRVVSTPVPPVVASSHRTVTRGDARPIATPVGLTSRFSSPI
jgi:hypothetical protein